MCIKMPTERNTGNKGLEFRRNMESYLDLFATTVTLIKYTITKDSMGRPTAKTETTSTIKADIQWVTKKELDYLNMGNVNVGDGMLFVEHDADIEIKDEIEYDNVRWRIEQKIEGEQISGNVVYKGYIIKKNKE